MSNDDTRANDHPDPQWAPWRDPEPPTCPACDEKICRRGDHAFRCPLSYMDPKDVQREVERRERLDRLDHRVHRHHNNESD